MSGHLQGGPETQPCVPGPPCGEGGIRSLETELAAPLAQTFPLSLSCPQGERATGFGVALLLALFGRASEDPLLNLVSPLDCEVDAQEGDNMGRDSKRRRLV